MNVLKLCEVQMYIAQNDATYIRELKRTPSAKFETMISEPRPKQRKSGQSNWKSLVNTHEKLFLAKATDL